MIVFKKPVAILSVVLLGTMLCPTDIQAQSSKEKKHLKQSIAHLPDEMRDNINAHSAQFLKMIKELEKMDDLYDLTILVDKNTPLPADYAPWRLTDVSKQEWAVTTRANILISDLIFKDLKRMVLAAKAEGITLTIGSGYRDYAYQKNVFENWIKKLGEAKAKRLSAPPGHSQHQLGTVVDFSPIDASFNGTKQQVWLAQHAHKYGFSLSYPAGYEGKTGYSYESWHYRYIGPLACEIQNQFFDGLQYLFLEWWNNWANKMYTNS